MKPAAGATIAVHPSFMGDEYLPDRQEEEIEIARITIASVTQDVTCIYASRAGDGITSRAVDEHEGETLRELVGREFVLWSSLEDFKCVSSSWASLPLGFY